jgi:hypothetical protein
MTGESPVSLLRKRLVSNSEVVPPKLNNRFGVRSNHAMAAA